VDTQRRKIKYSHCRVEGEQMEPRIK